MLRRFYDWVILMVIMTLSLTACNVQQKVPPVSTPFEQQTLEATSTMNVVATLPLLPSLTPVPSESPGVDQTVTIYLVAIEDNGISGKKIGCDDSLVAVEVPASSSLAAPWNALEALLSLKETYYGESGLYNALYQSSLDIQSSEINAGKAKVYLEGELILGGVCDQPRVEEQIMTTILDNSQVNEVDVFINGTLLQDYLSLK